MSLKYNKIDQACRWYLNKKSHNFKKYNKTNKKFEQFIYKQIDNNKIKWEIVKSNFFHRSLKKCVWTKIKEVL